AAIMIAIELTLIVEKPHAVLFVGIILGLGLTMRFVSKSVLPARAKRRAAAVFRDVCEAGGRDLVRLVCAAVERAVWDGGRAADAGRGCRGAGRVRGC